MCCSTVLVSGWVGDSPSRLGCSPVILPHHHHHHHQHSLPLPSVHKTEEELQAMLAAKEEKLQLRAQRREQQAQNVQRKREQREAHKWVQGGMVLRG